MATQYQILKLLTTTSPRSRTEIAEMLGEGYRGFQTQLDRLCQKGFIQDMGDHSYILTAEGYEALANLQLRDKLALPERFAITITEFDLMQLDEKTLTKVWRGLGKILQNRYHPHKNEAQPLTEGQQTEAGKPLT